MLKLAISQNVESFRNELRTWLQAHRPPVASDSSLETFVNIGRAWQKELASGKWLGVYWPAEFGGRGLSLVEEAVVQEELVRAGSPQILGLFGLTMVGPVLIKHGSLPQKQRYLAKILSGDEIWCQGFSEPGAGSDLAAISTKAISCEGGFKISGQKVWTSFAHVADWCFVLARTSESKKKHEGLSYFLVPMSAPGITVRPLRQISGDDEFNEVFFDEVFVPSENIVGAIGDGWKIAISTLMHERVVLTFARQLQSEKLLREMLTKQSELTQSTRIKLAKCVAEACATRALAYKHLLSYASGAEPGPEGSLDKLLWSESFQRLNHLAIEIIGPAIARGEKDALVGSIVHNYLYSRGRTIAAGSSEIQRNIIAERILDLPRLKFSK